MLSCSKIEPKRKGGFRIEYKVDREISGKADGSPRACRMQMQVMDIGQP